MIQNRFVFLQIYNNFAFNFDINYIIFIYNIM